MNCNLKMLHSPRTLKPVTNDLERSATMCKVGTVLSKTTDQVTRAKAVQSPPSVNCMWHKNKALEQKQHQVNKYVNGIKCPSFHGNKNDKRQEVVGTYKSKLSENPDDRGTSDWAGLCLTVKRLTLHPNPRWPR